ncbi:MAG TPA: DNA primase [Terriglobales bacterium]|nr:DNA primase [Terriglobales bacterium]
MLNPGDFAYTVKQQADIVCIIGDYVKLKKSGAQNFSGLCPFHDEKSPSFSVHSTRQFFHCFGCNASGDVFTFVQKIENVSFPEAVRSIATRLNIPLPKQQFSPQEAKEASQGGKLLDLHEAACAFFQSQLKTSAAASAREYLSSRGLKDEVIDQFRIGYAPDSGFLLRDRLKNEFDEGTLKQSGLFSWKDEEGGTGAMYAKFRNRIIFPISSEQGKVIAFGGRILLAAAADKDKAGPKYLNSPETLIYSKGKVLYNLDKAREAIRKLDYSIVVEGYLDCISVFTAGMHNVIASSGTAFGEAQVKLLGRYSKNIVVNFDPDTAGAAATERSLAMLIEEDFNIKVITLEPGLDPDLFIRKRGVEAYQAEVRSSRKYFHYLIDRALAQFAKTPEGKVKAMNYLLPHIQRVPSRIARDELASEAAQRLAIDSAVLRQELKSAASSRSKTIKADAAQGPTGLSPAEKILVRSLISTGPSNNQVRGTLVQTLEEERPHEGWGSEALLDALAQADSAMLNEPLSIQLDDADRKHLAELLMSSEDGEEPNADAVRLALAALRRPHLERKLQHLQPQIDEAGRKGDSFKLAQLSAEKLKLKRALDESMRAIHTK